MRGSSDGRRDGVRPAAVLAALVVVAAVVAALAWRLDGGRWEIISTPSMGTAAPVGTLILTAPAETVAVGDLLTYRPAVPNHPQTVTHRVVAVGDEGGTPTYRTRGDINGAEDPWTVRPADVEGVVAAALPGLGWLVRALPVLIVGIAALWWVTGRWVPRRWGVPLRVLGLSLIVAGTITWLKPFVGVVTLASVADAVGSHLTLVSTGMLPIRAEAATGGSVDLRSGEVGVLSTVLPPEAKGTTVTSGIHMPVWLWIVMTLLWLTPMLYGLVHAWRHPITDADGPGGGDPDPPTAPIPVAAVAAAAAGQAPPTGLRARLRRGRILGTSIVTALVVLLAVATSATSAAFTARIVNAASTAGSAAYFTCAAASTGVGTGVLNWPLDDATVLTGTTARDLSGNGRTGTYTGLFTTGADQPCARDTPARAVTLVPTALTPSYVATTATTGIRSTNTFSLALRFKTTTTSGGRMIGWGGSRIGQSTTYDRHLYMTNGGQIVFGVYPNAVRTITSPAAYNDGQWHSVVATLSTAGMVLYMDGVQVAADPTTTTAEGGTANTGFWRVGWDNLSSWTSRPTTDYWAGSMARAAVYPTALTAAQVTQLDVSAD